jgi:hypothetical protein
VSEISVELQRRCEEIEAVYLHTESPVIRRRARKALLTATRIASYHDRLGLAASTVGALGMSVAVRTVIAIMDHGTTLFSAFNCWDRLA